MRGCGHDGCESAPSRPPMLHSPTRPRAAHGYRLGCPPGYFQCRSSRRTSPMVEDGGGRVCAAGPSQPTVPAWPIRSHRRLPIVTTIRGRRWNHRTSSRCAASGRDISQNPPRRNPQYGNRTRPDGSNKLIVSDIIELLIEALKAIGVADKKLLQAWTKADDHDPGSSDST